MTFGRVNVVLTCPPRATKRSANVFTTVVPYQSVSDRVATREMPIPAQTNWARIEPWTWSGVVTRKKPGHGRLGAAASLPCVIPGAVEPGEITARSPTRGNTCSATSEFMGPMIPTAFVADTSAAACPPSLGLPWSSWASRVNLTPGTMSLVLASAIAA